MDVHWYARRDLDRLAATGVRFTQAVANLPVCVPCRHSFITGMYPHQSASSATGITGRTSPLVPTLGHRLQEAGYATASVGKMHWKNRTAPDEHVPDKRGSTSAPEREETRMASWTWRLPGGWKPGKNISAPISPRASGAAAEPEGYVGDVAPLPAAALPETWLANQAVDYLQRHHQAGSQQPFCLMVSLDRPHPPNVIPADYDGTYDPQDVPLPPCPPAGFQEDDPHVRRQVRERNWNRMDEQELRTSVLRYLTNVTFVDDCLGKVLTTLDDLGYADNTLVVLLSDHGELLGERGAAHTKYSLYDSAVRVPLIVRWPGVSRPGLVSSAAVELVDLMPTWLEAAQVDVPPYLPGRSLRPLLEGSAPETAGWRELTLSEQFTAGDRRHIAGWSGRQSSRAVDG